MDYVIPKFQELIDELGPDATNELTLAQKIEIALFAGILPNQDGTVTKPDHPSIRVGSIKKDGAMMTWKNSVSLSISKKCCLINLTNTKTTMMTHPSNLFL